MNIWKRNTINSSMFKVLWWLSYYVNVTDPLIIPLIFILSCCKTKIPKYLVVKIQNLVVNHESQPVKSNPVMGLSTKTKYFNLNWQRIIPCQTRKNKNNHWIVHIWSTKFQLKLTILIFGLKFTQKGCFQSKTEKVNTTNKFYISELVYVLIA